jgi:hypothetical protein
LLEQLKHVGDSVPSQQRNPPPPVGGVVPPAGVTVIALLRSVCSAQRFVSSTVTVSVPLRAAQYCAANEPLPPPEVIENVLPSDDLTIQETAPASENVMFALEFCATAAGTFSVPVACASSSIVTDAEAPGPHVFEATAVSVRLPNTVSGILPVEGSPPETPTIVTAARGSLAVHDSVTDSPAHAVARDVVKRTVGSVQAAAGTSRPTERRFAAKLAGAIAISTRIAAAIVRRISMWRGLSFSFRRAA